MEEHHLRIAFTEIEHEHDVTRNLKKKKLKLIYYQMEEERIQNTSDSQDPLIFEKQTPKT